MNASTYADRLNVDAKQIAAFCQRWQIVELALFGSILREDFHPQSDIDVLVTFADNAAPGLIYFAQMAQELETLFGRKVDAVTRRSVENSPNHIRRAAILNNAQVIYAAG
jgi:predicted nucleotidyltransferase